MEITKERLQAYRSIKAEIHELNCRLEHLHEDETMIGSSTVLDYRSGYPVAQSVVGINWDRWNRIKTRCENKIRKLEKECCEIEEYIENIDDSMTRRIFRMYFLEGKKQKEIGKAVHLDRSIVSRKINALVKVAHKTQKSHL